MFANKKKDLVRIELSFLQEVSTIVRVNMKLCRLSFDPFLPLVISKQQTLHMLIILSMISTFFGNLRDVDLH